MTRNPPSLQQGHSAWPPCCRRREWRAQEDRRDEKRLTDPASPRAGETIVAFLSLSTVYVSWMTPAGDRRAWYHASWGLLSYNNSQSDRATETLFEDTDRHWPGTTAIFRSLGVKASCISYFFSFLLS